MPSVEVLVYILTGAITLISVLFGVVWKMLRDEGKAQSATIQKKADVERLQEAEVRWQHELTSVKDGNERLINKLEQRHDREIEQLGTRLSSEIKTSENNILAQFHLMMELFKAATK